MPTHSLTTYHRHAVYFFFFAVLISPDGFPYDPRVVEFRCFRWCPFSLPHLGSVTGSLTLLSFSPTFAELTDH